VVKKRIKDKMKFDDTEFLILLATLLKDIDVGESFKKDETIVKIDDAEIFKAEKMYEDIR
jgi:hypothetical protein